jgi:hypothetical protein
MTFHESFMAAANIRATFHGSIGDIEGRGRGKGKGKGEGVTIPFQAED